MARALSEISLHATGSSRGSTSPIFSPAVRSHPIGDQAADDSRERCLDRHAADDPESLSVLDQVADVDLPGHRAVRRCTQHTFRPAPADHTRRVPVSGAAEPAHSTRPNRASAHGLDHRMTVDTGGEARPEPDDESRHRRSTCRCCASRAVRRRRRRRRWRAARGRPGRGSPLSRRARAPPRRAGLARRACLPRRPRRPTRPTTRRPFDEPSVALASSQTTTGHPARVNRQATPVARSPPPRRRQTFGRVVTTTARQVPVVEGRRSGS